MIDALNEYLDTDEMRRKFLCELQKLRPNLRLIITSRLFILDIEAEFSNVYRLDIHARDEDIKLYLKKRMKMEAKLRLNISEKLELQEMIINIITEKAKGMYKL